MLVQSRLSSQENMWLSRLRRNLKRDEDIEELAKAYLGKEKDPLYSAAMDMIVRANWKAYKEGADMCDALNELFAEKYAEKLEAMRETVTAEVKEAVSEENKAKGKAESVIELLTDLGLVPENLRKRILSEKDHEILSKWLRLAAKADSMDDFMMQMDR